MHMVLLTLHVLISTILVLATIGVFASGWLRRPTKAYRAMQVTLAGTLSSGVVMLFVGFGGIGRICAAMTAVTLGAVVARYYYRNQLAQTS